ncbi:hypothetical protein M9H77_03411 [Catharanthus roseus]|uniref:Uncharacterized protein n=1 Tax=Catharanthus roseus TaxID=4058 RepID=A0ACC0CBN1_CATRO|nr:hypothetical protein M9H77_03411 [Catharanthus roseus]
MIKPKPKLNNKEFKIDRSDQNIWMHFYEEEFRQNESDTDFVKSDARSLLMNHKRGAWSKKSFPELFSSNSSSPAAPIVKRQSLQRGASGFLEPSEISTLAAPLKLTLVGKFFHGRPSIEVLRKEFHTMGFKGYPLLVFKWSSSFHLVAKPSVLPTWMSLEGLPIHFFNKGVLFSIATATGKLFKIDEATANFIRPSVFRVCIEVRLRASGRRLSMRTYLLTALNVQNWGTTVQVQTTALVSSQSQADKSKDSTTDAQKVRVPKSLPDGATLQQQIQEAALQSATTSISGSQDDQALDASLEKHALATVMVAEAAYDEVLELHVEKPATTGVEQGAAQPAAKAKNSTNSTAEIQQASPIIDEDDVDFIMEGPSLMLRMGQPSSSSKSHKKTCYFCIITFIEEVYRNVIIWNMCGVGNYASFARIKKLVLDHFLLVLAIIEPLIDNSNRLYYCHRLGYDDASFTTNVYGMIWVIFLVLGWFEEISIFFHSTEECFGSIPPSLPSREFGDMITEYAFCNLPFV